MPNRHKRKNKHLNSAPPGTRRAEVLPTTNALLQVLATAVSGIRFWSSIHSSVARFVILPPLVYARHVHVCVGNAARRLAPAARAVLALEQRLAVLVHLDLGDLDLRRVNAHVHGVACFSRYVGKQVRIQIARRVAIPTTTNKAQIGAGEDMANRPTRATRKHLHQNNCVPLAFSLVIRSMWMTNLRR